MFSPLRVAGAVFAVASLCGCAATSMQRYADLERPAHPIQHIAASLLPALSSEAKTQEASVVADIGGYNCVFLDISLDLMA